MENVFNNSKIELLGRGELSHYIDKMQNGDEEARNKIINHYIYIVKKIIERNYSDNKEELLSVGLIGMLKAVNNCVSNEKHHLTTFVSTYVKKEIDKYLKIDNNENMVKTWWLNDEANLMDDYEVTEKYEKLRSAIDKLPYFDSVIIKLHFGIDCHKSYSIKEIAKIFNFSSTWIEQKLKKTIVRLYNILQFEPIKKLKKSGNTKPFYRIFEGYTCEEVSRVLLKKEEEKLELINHLYDAKYDVSLARWNELEEKEKIEFYQFVDEIRDELKENSSRVKFKNF